MISNRILSGGIVLVLALAMTPSAASAASAESGSVQSPHLAAHTSSSPSTSTKTVDPTGLSTNSPTSQTTTSGIAPNVVNTVGGRHVAVPVPAGASAAVSPKATSAASGATLYVNNQKGSNCSDTATGAGSQTVPFCTLQAAANGVTAGDTVLVTPSSYQPFTISAQGTASAPITFELVEIGRAHV